MVRGERSWCTKRSAWVTLAVACFGSGCQPEPSLLPGRSPGSPGTGAGGREVGAGSAVGAEAALDAVIFPGADGESPGQALVRAIAEARTEIWMTMYLLTSAAAIDALVGAHQAGCDVRVLLEAQPYGAEIANQPALARLSAAGVDVRSVRRPVGLVHEKSMIIDRRTLYVLSLNLTTAGLGSNREYGVIDTEPADVARAAAVFAADLLGTGPSGTGAGAGAGAGAQAAAGYLLVSPVDARTRLAEAIARARISLRIEMEEFSDGSVADAVIAAWQRGVTVQLVAPARGRSFGTDALLARLAAAGVEVVLLETPVVHAKAMVVDGTTLYVGSMNFTRASLDDNRELGVLFDDSAAATLVGKTIELDASLGTAVVASP